MACSKKLVRNTSVAIRGRSSNVRGDGPEACIIGAPAVTKMVSNIAPNRTSDLTGPQLLSTLQIMQEINEIKLEDLDIDNTKDFKCSAVTFDKNERLYSGLINLDNDSSCHMKQARSAPHVSSLKRDPVPNIKDIASGNSGVAYQFFRQVAPPVVTKDSLIGSRSTIPKLFTAKR